MPIWMWLPSLHVYHFSFSAKWCGLTGWSGASVGARAVHVYHFVKWCGLTGWSGAGSCRDIIIEL